MHAHHGTGTKHALRGVPPQEYPDPSRIRGDALRFVSSRARPFVGCMFPPILEGAELQNRGEAAGPLLS